MHLSWNEMFEKFRFGSYRIDDSELANSKKNHLKLNSILVNCLDGSKLNLEIDVSTFIMNYVISKKSLNKIIRLMFNYLFL